METSNREQTIPTIKKRRSSRQEYLPFYRRKRAILISTAILVVAAAILLPPKGYVVPGMNFRLYLFIFLMMLWSGNILSDKTKPIWLQGIAAASLYGILIWYLYAYVEINFSGLGHVFFNMNVMVDQWNLMFQGLTMTILLAVCAIFFATIIGLIIAIFRIINNPTLNIVLISYLEFCRAMPLLVILMIVYFGLPQMNIRLSPFISGVFVLSMIDGAYISEIFRSGISSIHHTQIESAHALGFNTFQTMRLVVVPQAFRIVIPPLTNQWVSILKDTAVVSIISVTELLKSAMIINTWKANPTPLIVASMIYLIILIPLTLYTKSLEKKGGRFHKA